jgi:hypothetical protein
VRKGDHSAEAFDRAGDEGGIGDELGALSGVFPQPVDAAADELLVTVPLPATASKMQNPKISSSDSVLEPPFASGTSACTRALIMSSVGFFLRASTQSPK